MVALIEVDELTRRAQSLEPLPDSLVRLSALVAREDPDLKEIVETIAFDQALTGKLLGYANSAVSAAREPITSVRKAIVRMGLGSVLSFTMAACVRSGMNQAVPEYGLGEGQLWRHSVGSALAAECMAQVLDTVPPESFTAALLHDVGKLVLARNVDPDFLSLLEHTIKEAGVTRMAAEVQLISTHHGQLGGWIADHWGLPEGIVEGIVHHHMPDYGSRGVADVVHVANEVAKILDASADESDAFFELIQPVQPAVADRLGLDEARMERVVDLATERYDQVLTQYS